MVHINEYLELKDRGVNGFRSVTFEALDDCVEHPLPDGHLLWVIISRPLKQIIILLQNDSHKNYFYNCFDYNCRILHVLKYQNYHISTLS